MDGSHFDTLVKTLATTRLTRLQSVRGLVASGVAALAGITRLSEEAVAKKNHEKKVKICKCPDANAATCRTAKVKKSRAKKQPRKACNYKGACRAGVTGCAGGCTPSCEQRICGDNGCGGSCGTCEAGQVCATGRCVSSCPSGQKVCAGNCIPSNQCCTNADCPAASPRCCRGSCSQCCTEADCPPSAACFNAACICPGSPAVPALVQGCCGSADCATGCRCAQINPGAVFACVADTPCPTGVPQCFSNAECGANAVCNENCGGVCTPLCT
jgi:hypothetical protein